MNDCAVAVPEEVRPSSPPNSLDSAIRTLLGPMWETLSRIDARLDERLDGREAAAARARGIASDKAPPGTIGAAIAGLHRSLDQFQRGVTEIREQLNALPSATVDLKSLAAAKDPAVPRAAASAAVKDDAWERILFGDELAAAAPLAVARKALLNDLLAGGPEAVAFAGQMLLVRAASVEELPELIHRVGEAYYRWRPRTDETDEPLEQALADSLSRRAESVGLRNTIQLVRVGDRFDAGRHVTDGRGVEVAAVHGWIVLRDNHKVYTKAGVSVK